MRLCKLSTARDIMVFLVSAADHVTGLAGATLTITASKNAAAFASITPTVTDRGNGWYKLALTSSHTDTLGDLALHITAASADPIDTLMVVVAELPGQLAVDAVNNDSLASTAVSEILNGVWDEGADNHLIAGSFGEMINLIHGLSNGMVVVDSTTNTVDGMTVARLRVFTDAASVLAATDGGTGEGEIAIYTVSASYDAPGKLNVFKSRRTA